MNSIIEKIFKEIPIISDEFFHIVRDIDPICPEHYLVFPRNECRCLAELPFDLKMHLNKLISNCFNYEKFGFFERGNVNFCTSMNTPAYAHGHLVNIKYFKNELVHNLLKNNISEKYDSIANGLDLLTKDTEYLLSSIVNGACMTVSPFSSKTKRYIRSILEENVNNEIIH